MVGQIKLNDFDACALPQRAASAFSILNNLMGASYKPLLFLGTQVVKGVNYYFIAEQTVILEKPVRHIVTVAINEFAGEYEIVPNSIEAIL